MTPYDYAAQVDASQGFAANGDLFKRMALGLAEGYRAEYEHLPAGDKFMLLQAVRDAVGVQFVAWDDEFGWDYPAKGDAVEDFFLYAIGAGLAHQALTGSLKGALGGPAVTERATYAGYQPGRA